MQYTDIIYSRPQSRKASGKSRSKGQDRTGGLMPLVQMQPIGVVCSPYKEKFGIPRQPGLVRAAEGMIQLLPDPDLRTALRTLEDFSHLWVIFLFHENDSKNWKPSIRPPRLGGAKKVGSLASRSPHRPNPIGLSAVEIIRIDAKAEPGAQIWIRGLDLLDGTPVLDVKPYIDYTDRVDNTKSGWAAPKIVQQPVAFSPAAEEQLTRLAADGYPNLRQLIRELLALDPRPASLSRKSNQPTTSAPQPESYGFNVLHWDVKWHVRQDGVFQVDRLAPLFVR